MGLKEEIKASALNLGADQAILRRLDYIASDVAVFVEKVGGKAIPIPADGPYNYWDEENHRGMGDLSHKHAAQAAGLGILGKNSVQRVLGVCLLGMQEGLSSRDK
ncbi:hypothetical protein [Desulfosporosinus sp. FKA]|uniref:hypothetical protein n=1 Tax=Desulfosporosinus sp. FKA TaxID=1969834 RepID=UPI000B4972ED|nr:hypothetical protein [Desulfosporosinus sp. FKA]